MILATAERAIRTYCQSRVNCSPHAVFNQDGDMALVRGYYEYRSEYDDTWIPRIVPKIHVEQLHCLYARGRTFKVSLRRGMVVRNVHMISPYAEFKLLEQLIKDKLAAAAKKGREGLTDAELLNIRSNSFCRHPNNKELIKALLPWANLVSTYKESIRDKSETVWNSLEPGSRKLPSVDEFSNKSREELARRIIERYGDNAWNQCRGLTEWDGAPEYNPEVMANAMAYLQQKLDSHIKAL